MTWNPMLAIAANGIWPLLLAMPFVMWKAKPWLRIAYVIVVAFFAEQCGHLLTVRELQYQHIMQAKWTAEALDHITTLSEPARATGYALLARALKESALSRQERNEIEAFIATNKTANNTPELIR